MPAQAVALTVLLALIVAALLGTFSPRQSETSASVPRASLAIEYPSLSHYGLESTFRLHMRNTSDRPIARLELLLDGDYLQAFSGIRALPEPAEISDQGYRFLFENLPARATRVIVCDVHPEKLGLRRGHVRLSVEEEEPLTLPFRTFVFP